MNENGAQPHALCVEAVLPSCIQHLALENFLGFHLASLEHNASSAEWVLPTLLAKIALILVTTKKMGKNLSQKVSKGIVGERNYAKRMEAIN